MNNIVISYMLLSSASNGIVVLVDTHPVKHTVLGLDDLFHFLLSGALLDSLDRVEVVRSMEVGLAITNLLFGSLS